MDEFGRLPGWDLVAAGIDDLEAGIESAEALLVAIGRARLRFAGIEVPGAADAVEDPEKRLFRLLEGREPRGGHSAYNALLRRLISCERALELHAGRKMRMKRRSRS